MKNLDSLFQAWNNRLAYYVKIVVTYYHPKSLLTLDFDKFKPAIEQYRESLAYDRFNYYNKFNNQ
jgi:hypothetical protein